MEKNTNEHITPDMFEFAQKDTFLHDEKLKTKARGYFADALLRFKKNKSSVVAAWIIGFLILFAIFSPIISPYSVNDKDVVYTNYPPYIPSIAEKNIGMFDGSYTLNSQNELQLASLRAIGQETGMDPVIEILETYETHQKFRGQDRVTYSYRVKVNSYFMEGVRTMVLSYEEYEKIQQFQNETGIQVLYPVVEKADIYVKAKDTSTATDNPNIWYQCEDLKGTPLLDADGNFIPAYSSNPDKTYGEYHSQRIASDPGTYIYNIAKSGSVQVRLCYYNYYIYKNGHEPSYVMGTDIMGRDLFCAIGTGARFSLIFAVVVSAINLTLGAIYGAIQGYYGGTIDMVLDRISDVLSGVPFIVVATLFQLHLAQKVGVLVSFLFAFVMTGWIGMAALTRKQFYRFKGQEYVLAAKTLGASDKRLMFKHIFPNSLGTIITSCVLVIPGVISSETSLTYLGIVNLSSVVGTCIGELMSQGQAAMTTSPHAMLFPSLFVSLLLISFNLFGNGLRDAFNPSTRGTEG
ncbi:MAG: ABC transporter permease [Lachnospiraceae bacterium]|nr:ABC transporter permease [Lachnospiraceae bacterium]